MAKSTKYERVTEVTAADPLCLATGLLVALLTLRTSFQRRETCSSLFVLGWMRECGTAPPAFDPTVSTSPHIHVATYRRKDVPAPQVLVAASLACSRALGHCRGRANPAMHVARNGRVSGNSLESWCAFDGKVRAGTLWLRSAQRRPLAGANSGESQKNATNLSVFSAKRT